MKKKILIIFLLLLLITGCKNKEKIDEQEENIEPGTSILNLDSKTSYQDDKYNLDIDYKDVTVIKTYEEYQSFTKENKMTSIYNKKEFTNKSLIFIYINSGDAIYHNIVDVTDSGLITIETKPSECLEKKDKKRQFAIAKIDKKYENINYELKINKLSC